MLLSFNVPKPLDNHVQCAVDAAWAMQRDFGRIWRGWQLYELRHVHNRISIATGPVVLASVGPKQYRQETIIGTVVNHANKLCRVAPRDQDVIVVDGDVAKRVTGYRLEELTIPDTAVAKTPPRMFRVAGLA
jgi:class 3 adenylate cyclase